MPHIDFTDKSYYFNGLMSVELFGETEPNDVYTKNCDITLRMREGVPPWVNFWEFDVGTGEFIREQAFLRMAMTPTGDAIGLAVEEVPYVASNHNIPFLSTGGTWDPTDLPTVLPDNPVVYEISVIKIATGLSKYVGCVIVDVGDKVHLRNNPITFTKIWDQVPYWCKHFGDASLIEQRYQAKDNMVITRTTPQLIIHTASTSGPIHSYSVYGSNATEQVTTSPSFDPSYRFKVPANGGDPAVELIIRPADSLSDMKATFESVPQIISATFTGGPFPSKTLKFSVTWAEEGLQFEGWSRNWFDAGGITTYDFMTESCIGWQRDGDVYTNSTRAYFDEEGNVIVTDSAAVFGGGTISKFRSFENIPNWSRGSGATVPPNGFRWTSDDFVTPYTKDFSFLGIKHGKVLSVGKAYNILGTVSETGKSWDDETVGFRKNIFICDASTGTNVNFGGFVPQHYISADGGVPIFHEDNSSLFYHDENLIGDLLAGVSGNQGSKASYHNIRNVGYQSVDYSFNTNTHRATSFNTLGLLVQQLDDKIGDNSGDEHSLSMAWQQAVGITVADDDWYGFYTSETHQLCIGPDTNNGFKASSFEFAIQWLTVGGDERLSTGWMPHNISNVDMETEIQSTYSTVVVSLVPSVIGVDVRLEAAIFADPIYPNEGKYAFNYMKLIFDGYNPGQISVKIRNVVYDNPDNPLMEILTVPDGSRVWGQMIYPERTTGIIGSNPQYVSGGGRPLINNGRLFMTTTYPNKINAFNI